MLKLPFKSQPKKVETVTVGNETIGSLDIPKLGDLSVNERIYINQQMKDYPDLRSEAVKMARAIADKSGMKLIDVYNALTSGNSELLGDYLEEFVHFQDVMEKTSIQRRVVLASSMLKFRLVPEWEMENTGDANLIHPKLVEAIADFAQKEESGWAVPEPITEEELGKSKPELVAVA